MQTTKRTLCAPGRIFPPPFEIWTFDNRQNVQKHWTKNILKSFLQWLITLKQIFSPLPFWG